MSILVTGSAGHLGEAIVRTLRSQGKKAIGLDIKASPFTDFVGSVADRAFVAEAVKGTTSIIHSATLHKPHVATHSKQDFVDTNISGTLNLLEEAILANVQSFIFTSTTSVFGEAMHPGEGDPAAWVTEQLEPVPKNIYGVTKLAAENLCWLFHRKHQLPVLILRTSRFFPEEDDSFSVRQKYTLDNVQALEMLYRRVEIEDAVSAHLLAIEKAAEIRFGKYIISAKTPFDQQDIFDLRLNAAAKIEEYFPGTTEIFRSKSWNIFPGIDRVYSSQKAISELGWEPKCDFGYVLECLESGKDFRSQLAAEVGSKGYHEEQFQEGPYPVEP